MHLLFVHQIDVPCIEFRAPTSAPSCQTIRVSPAISWQSSCYGFSINLSRAPPVTISRPVVIPYKRWRGEAAYLLLVSSKWVSIRAISIPSSFRITRGRMMRVRRKPMRDTWRNELIMRPRALNRCRRAFTRKNARIRRKERRARSFVARVEI